MQDPAPGKSSYVYSPLVAYTAPYNTITTNQHRQGFMVRPRLKKKIKTFSTEKSEKIFIVNFLINAPN